MQTYSLALLTIINHSHSLVGLGLAKQWISLLRSVLGCFSELIHHIRGWEPRTGTLTSLSLKRGRRGNGHHHFNAPISTHLKTTSGRITACTAVNYYQLFVGQEKPPDLTVAGEHRDGPTAGEHFHGSPAVRPTHWIQCCSSVLSNTHTPLTLLKCTLTQLQLSLSLSFFISVFLSLWDLLTMATNRAVPHWGIKKEMGLTVLHPSLSLKMCVCVFGQCGNTPQLETKCIHPQRKHAHKKEMEQ